MQADLTRFALASYIFSVVICFKYRNRLLYSAIRTALHPGGLLIYETYTAEHYKYGFTPRNPAHLLGRNELFDAFGDWEMIFYHGVWFGCGTASRLARKPLRVDES